ncbi:helix-turn-helix transcriptional regulator [Mycobacterium sp. NPDC051198]
MTAKEYLFANDLEQLTGIPASTWRYWAHIGQEPIGLKLGRRRVWRRDVIEKWLADADAAGRASASASK